MYKVTLRIKVHGNDPLGVMAIYTAPEIIGDLRELAWNMTKDTQRFYDIRSIRSSYEVDTDTTVEVVFTVEGESEFVNKVFSQYRESLDDYLRGSAIRIYMRTNKLATPQVIEASYQMLEVL